ncbi:MAG: DUF4978 domain-containing protein [Clostridia bacterium]|nr:DUF4978 domain-containing protein [Clostridia bacterium]
MKMKKMIAALCAAAMAVSPLSAFAAETEGEDEMNAELLESGAYVGSKVVYSGEEYEREEVLEVAGEPFFYNGVQIRIDKVVDDPAYNFTDEQVKELFRLAKEDGFTVANVQIRWMDVQQDQSFTATESAYIRGGSYADKTFNTGGIEIYYDESSESNQALGYVKFDISGWTKSQAEAARIRLYNKSAVSGEHSVSIYALEDCTWSKDTITWNNAPGHDGYEISGELVSQSPSWDKVSAQEYFDFDVSDYIIEQQAKGKTSVSFIIAADITSGDDTSVNITFDDFDDDRPPTLYLSSMDEYDWDYLDRIIGYAEEYDLKMEVLWFATDTCSIVSELRVPWYVLQNYQKCVYSTGEPWVKKANSDITGIYYYLTCKNDLSLREQEAKVLTDVFNHIGEYNEAHGNKNTVIGCQVCNEPNVARLHNSSVTENGVKLQNCQCDTCVALKASGGYSDSEFKDYTLFEYCNNLSKAVKTSNYPVWTRVNNVNGCEAWGVTYNENKRASGGTDTDEGTYLDFIGLDPYGWSRSNLYAFGTGDYSTGHNLPMVMESGGEKSMSALMMLATVAGGAFYNVYDLCSPDGHALYNSDLTPRVISAGDTYLPNGGTYIEDIKNHNLWLNKIGYEIATKKTDKQGGKNLLFFNCEGTSTSDINVTKSIGGMDVTYKSDTIYSVGIAVKRSDNEVVLLSSKDEDATFTLSGIGTDVVSVEYGYYEGSEWVSEDGEVTYSTSGKDLVVTMPEFSVVRVVTENALPEPETYEFEDMSVSVTNSFSLETQSDSSASGGKWTLVRDATAGTVVTFTFELDEEMNASLATGYKSKSSGRGAVQMYVNGVKYGGALSQYGSSEEFTLSDYGPIVTLKKGTNTISYTVTASGIVTFDYLEIMESDMMPEELEGRVLTDEDFSEDDESSFGFSSGASVSDGTLKITDGMDNYTTSIKIFDAKIINQPQIDLTFDWTSNITSAGKKSGIEFRDLYGRLIFAIASKSGSVLRYSVTGADSDSANAEYDREPTWTEIDMSRGTTYTIRLYCDFEEKTVSYSITEKSTGNMLAVASDIPTEATSLAKMIACNYYTNESGKSYAGTQTIDNFKIVGSDENVELPYADRTIYAFGDSVVAGHKYDAGFADFAARQMGAELSYNASENGAAVMDGTILSQIESAPEEAPDIVIFDGGVNDAYSTNAGKWGEVGDETADFDTATFAGCFENLISQMKAKWGDDTKLCYVAVHKTAARDSDIQELLHEIELEACEKWGVIVADVYSNPLIDTNDDTIRWNYTFDDLGSDYLPGTMATISSEKFSSTYPSGTHPNFRAIEEFYVPAVIETLGDYAAKILSYDAEAKSVTFRLEKDETVNVYFAAFDGNELTKVRVVSVEGKIGENTAFAGEDFDAEDMRVFVWSKNVEPRMNSWTTE